MDNTVTIPVRTGKPYDVLVGQGILPNLGDEIQKIGGSRYQKAAIISDDVVYSYYGKIVEDSLRNAGYPVHSFTFANGELSKSMPVLLEMLEFLAEHYFTRSDLIVALGGGVTGDMAGFAAAVYQRGMDYVQVPTTLLAAIDSSVGGKTAVNIPQGKNLVGAFWQPRLVLHDTDTLDTLEPDIFADGVAEAIKYGCIWDQELFGIFEAGDLRRQLIPVIARCVEIKAEVVAQDERDTGLRQILNFGHTLGHGVEKLSGFATSHGKAVAIGMRLMADACVGQGLLSPDDARRIGATIARHQLPVSCGYDIAQLCDACLGDKKRAGDAIHFITLERIGKAAIHPVKTDALLSFFTQNR